jgi:CSLREA domain-containing protein
MRRGFLSLILGLALLSIPFADAGPVLAATITVDTIADELNADGDCSLREAIQAANSDTAIDACTAGSGPDTIQVPPGSYPLTIAGSFEDQNQTGDLDVRSDLIIVGTGVAPSEIDAAGLGDDRGMHIRCVDVPFPGSPVEIDVTLQNLRFANGSRTTGIGPGGGGGALGGGVLVQDCLDGNFPATRVPTNVTIEDSQFDGNAAQVGGGLRGETLGVVTIRRSTFTNNTALNIGGGMSIGGADGTTIIEDSTISGNWVVSSGNVGAGGGAGMFINDTTTIRRTTISGNVSDTHGGGVACQNSTAIFENSTISGNTGAGQGGGGVIQGLNGSNPCTITLDSCTITGNLGSIGGGYLQNAGSATATNTIVAGNSATISGPDISGNFASGDYNLIGDGTGGSGATQPNDLVGFAGNPIDPGLGALQDNGGSTRTHLPRPDSLAVDTGATGLFEDQRGEPRPHNAVSDRGSVEAQPRDLAPLPTLSVFGTICLAGLMLIGSLVLLRRRSGG